MKIQRNKQHYETMELSKKKMLFDKQQIRDTADKHDKQLKKVQKYKTMHSDKKNDLLNKKYKLQNNGCCQGKNLPDKHAEKYKTMDTGKKQELLERCKETLNCNSNNITLDSCIQQFKKKIREGPYYVYCVCNRALYKKSVLKLITNSYPCWDILSIQTSFDGKQYICKTCHSNSFKKEN